MVRQADPPIFVPYGILFFYLLYKGSSEISGERKEGVARLEFTGCSSGTFLWCSMKNNSALQKWQRLSQKQLDTQFINALVSGLQCSPFEAAAIVDTVYKTYAPYFQINPSLKPGQMFFQVIAVDNAPSVPLSHSKQLTVTLTLDDPHEDLDIRKQAGVITLRRHRIQRVCTEAFQQGGLLTVEDLANRLFNCGERTICRDLQALRKNNIVVPLRSTIKDMGRTLSHRTAIITHWLSGHEYTEIARRTCHSVQAVKNYVDKFKRVVALAQDQYEVYTIAFLVKLAPSLVNDYIRIYQASTIIPHRKTELHSFLKKNPCMFPIHGDDDDDQTT